ncbi:MAG: hypothetical protein QW625_00580 [Candidatus Nanoarchaeia archaeon]
MAEETYPIHSLKENIKIEEQQLENLKRAIYNAIYPHTSLYEELKQETELVLRMLHYYSILERAISELKQYDALLAFENDPVKVKEFIDKIAKNHAVLLKYIKRYEEFMQQIIELKPSFDHLIEVLKSDLQYAKLVEKGLKEVFEKFGSLFVKKEISSRWLRH